MPRLRTARLVVLMGLSLGCNITPAHNQLLDSPQQPVSFWGYTLAPNREIRVECRYDLEWHELATIWSSSAGTPDSPGSSSMVYQYEESVQVPDECWVGGGLWVVDPEHPPPGVQTHWGATLRVIDVISGQWHESFMATGQSCLIAAYTATGSFIQSYQECATPTISDEIRLYGRIAPDP